MKTDGKMSGKETLFFHMGPVIAGGLPSLFQKILNTKLVINI